MATIATCPHCSASVDPTQEYAWCVKCGEPLPETILGQLSGVVALRKAAASSDAMSIASSSLPKPQESIVAEEVIEGDYLVIPFIGRINTGFFSTENAGTVSRQLQSLINRHSQQGWEFHSITKVGVEVAPGCLAGLFGATTSYIAFDQVIFRRARL